MKGLFWIAATAITLLAFAWIGRPSTDRRSSPSAAPVRVPPSPETSGSPEAERSLLARIRRVLDEERLAPGERAEFERYARILENRIRLRAK